VILIDEFALVGGAFKAIMNYYKHKNAESERVLILNRSVRFRFIKYLLVILFSPRILINSLSSFNSWSLIFISLLRRDLIIYLHETETAINAYKRNNKLKFFFLSKALRRNKIACVSNYMRKYYEENFGSKTMLIYDYYTPTNIILPKREGRKIILMAGYLMERKGVSFYSKLADYVVDDLKLPWDFYWAGGKASNDKMYQSKNVVWLGDVDLMDFLYPQIDAFILTSVDEPSGLVSVEALKYYKHVVAYNKAGSSEILEMVKGCKVYHSYEVVAAVKALKDAFEEKIDKSKIDYIINELISTETFIKAIDNAFLEDGKKVTESDKNQNKKIKSLV
jgi:hypothetical protein